MSYRWARWLPDAIKKEGVKVVLEPGWSNRGRYRADGSLTGAPNWDFEPNGLVTLHHTASTSSARNPFPTKTLLIKGRSDLPGPLCHGAPDHNGVVHIIAAGRANHSGVMSGKGKTVKGSDGNVVSIGFEIDTNGTQVMPHAQYVASIKCAAAVNRHFKRTPAWTMAHGETSVTGKWDPGENGKMVNMTAWRRAVAECLSYPPGVWHSKSGKNSWGEVKESSLTRGGDSASIRRLQWRIKRANKTKVPYALRQAVKVNGDWDDATAACVKAWQQNVWAAKHPKAKGVQSGKRLGPAQAKALFGVRYHLVD